MPNCPASRCAAPHYHRHGHLEDEELDPSEWVPRWLQFLLAHELPLTCAERLWDTYFASAEGFALHPYVCVAILELFQEDLLELEYPEAKGFLQHLPVMDMERVISHASAMWEEEEAAGRRAAAVASGDAFAEAASAAGGDDDSPRGAAGRTQDQAPEPYR